METLKAITWRGAPLDSQRLLVPVTGGSVETWGEHQGELIEISNEEGALHAAWVYDDDQKKAVAVVFDRDQWTPREAKLWVAEARRMSEKGEKVEEELAFSIQGMVSTFFFGTRRAPQEIYTGAVSDVESDVSESQAAAVTHEETAKSQDEASREEQAGSSDFSAAAETETPLAFSVTDTAATEAGQDDHVWKCIWRAGVAKHPITHTEVIVTETMLQAVHDSFGKVAGIEYVDVPLGHHMDAPDKNTGYVREVQIRAGGKELWGRIEFTDPVIREKVRNRSIPDVSVAVVPNVPDRERKDVKHPWALWHVALTTKPLMPGLRPFSVGDKEAEAYEMVQAEKPEETTMELTKEQIAEAMKLHFGVSPDDIAAQRSQLEAQTTRMQEFAVANRGRNVRDVVSALEGKLDLDGVTKIDGYRHYPAVITAVEKAMKDQPAALQMSVGADGTSVIDPVILEVINAIPKEGRMKLQEFSAADLSEEKERKDDDVVTDEDADEFLRELGLSL